jgi:hypothetical protein
VSGLWRVVHAQIGEVIIFLMEIKVKMFIILGFKEGLGSGETIQAVRCTQKKVVCMRKLTNNTVNF